MMMMMTLAMVMVYYCFCLVFLGTDTSSWTYFGLDCLRFVFANRRYYFSPVDDDPAATVVVFNRISDAPCSPVHPRSRLSTRPPVCHSSVVDLLYRKWDEKRKQKQPTEVYIIWFGVFSFWLHINGGKDETPAGARSLASIFVLQFLSLHLLDLFVVVRVFVISVLSAFVGGFYNCTPPHSIGYRSDGGERGNGSYGSGGDGGGCSCDDADRPSLFQFCWFPFENSVHLPHSPGPRSRSRYSFSWAFGAASCDIR